MELKYIILTIIKILISVPTNVMAITHTQAEPAVMVAGHFDNSSNNSNITSGASANLTNAYEFKIDLSEPKLPKNNETNNQESSSATRKAVDPPQRDTSEEIPDPSALVVPGYNLPESIFNKGKPFYLERDPVTGNIDFENKPPLPKLYDEYDEYFEEDQPNGYDIHDKANINRKDSGNIGSHKPSDINQLTPNFHDFLNLPVKYNPDKYVYPLISSSYANTKVQGNVNKIHNHKDYSVTTYKPNYNYPTFYTTKHYFGGTTTQKATTSTHQPAKHTTEMIYFTSTNTEKNLMNSPMNHPSFGQQKYQNLRSKLQTTTKKTMSLFEQLFGDYDEEVTTTVATTEPTTIKHEIYNGNKITNGHMAPAQEQNILNGTKMAHEYEDDDLTDYPTSVTDNVMVETKKHPLLIQVTTPQQEIMKTPTKKTPNTYQVSEVDFRDGIDVTEYEIRKDTTTAKSTTITPNVEKVVTLLPIGNNHVTQKQPIIVATQNLREKLASERVEGAKPFSKVPNQSNIHIAADQDTVSFVVGHHQNVDGAAGSVGQYQGTALKESPYDSNPFRPVYGVQQVPQENTKYNTISLQSNNKEDVYYQKYPVSVEEKDIFISKVEKPQVVALQPIRNSEASLAIGDPISSVEMKLAGQVVDDQLEINEETTIEFPKGTGPKIVFPDDKPTTYSPPHHLTHQLLPNRDNQILQLSSKPMFHPLPSDLTPPREHFPSNKPPYVGHPKVDRVRPPWDPRPGHFHQGRPEYARPPRPPPNNANNEIYKRIDTLPNILPQFRPNMNNRASPPRHPGQPGHGHHQHHLHPQRPQNNNHAQGPKTNYVRQPLLERPSNNRPIGFFEKLHPPSPQQNVLVPPSPPKSLQNIRKVPALENEITLKQQQHQQAEDRIMNNLNIKQTPHEASQQQVEPLFGFLNAPPKVVLSNRRNGLLDDPEVETLQMIQAKLIDRKENSSKVIVKANMNGKDTLEKPLYVVYPVNTSPVKLDTLNDNKKETVVIGTRAELPLPPSKISSSASDSSKEFNFEQNDRHDSPVLKPHYRPSTYPIKSDFPYPLERPDPSILNPPVPENANNNLDTPQEGKLPDEPTFMLSNQWNTIDMDENHQNEARIVNAGKINTNQISATLKTYTEKPIAVAYTPTEPTSLPIDVDRYSLPNYASLVIPEIRQGQVAAANPASEFTVSAVMHTHNQNTDLATQNMVFIGQNQQHQSRRPATDQESDPLDSNNRIAQQEFQAPFQASANLDAMNSPSQGWAVINRNKDSSSKDDSSDTTLLPLATIKEFDIENFKPQLEGGFKPIYSYPDVGNASKDTKMQVNERQEK